MPKITFQEAKEFLNNITSEDNVAIIHHDDGDGFCSGILYYDWCEQKGAKTEEFTYILNKSKLKDYDLQKFNKIILTDLASGVIAEELDIILDKQVFYTDHHPEEGVFPKEILTLITGSKGYTPSSRTAGELTELKPFLALIGTVTDAGDLYQENQNFIDEHLKQIGMTLEELKQNVTSVVTNLLVYLDKDFDKAFKILQQINSIEEISKLKKYSEPVEKEIQKFIKEYESKKEKLGDVNFYYFEPKLSIKTPVGGIISQNDKDGAFIFATPKNDGKHITLSARNTSQKINMADMLKAGVEDLEDGNAGGHVPAAGGIILVKDIDKFKQNIRNFLENK